MAYLRIANLKKKYRISRTEHQEVLKGLNVEFKRGELVAVLGESGCGKSTFMNILGGLDNDYTGSVVYDGQFFKDYTEKQLDDWRKHSSGRKSKSNFQEKKRCLPSVAYTPMQAITRPLHN